MHVFQTNDIPLSTKIYNSMLQTELTSNLGSKVISENRSIFEQLKRIGLKIINVTEI